MAQAKEIILWGLLKDKTDRAHEVLLLSNVKSKQHLEKVMALALSDGFHSFRISNIDMSIPPDFTK